jgi:hypothetical protein
MSMTVDQRRPTDCGRQREILGHLVEVWKFFRMFFFEPSFKRARASFKELRVAQNMSNGAFLTVLAAPELG